MIFTNRTITVRKGESRIDEPIVVYRGDYELEVRFTILNSKFNFKSGTNMIETEKASYGQLAILTPYGGNIFSDIVKCNDGSVTFVLTAEMLNQIEEVGLYSFQIRLMDYNKESRVSIPPIEFGIEVREPIASEDHDNSVNNAIVGYSIAKVVDPKEENVGDTFDESGNYNKTKWETGDRISEGKLNKIEDAIDKVNRNEKDNTATLSRRIDNNFNVLDAVKADKNAVFSMANMGQDIKEAMTGGSVAVVGKNSVLTENIVDKQVTWKKTNFIEHNYSLNLFNGEYEKIQVHGDRTIGMYIRSNENARTAVIKISPNTTYSVIKNKAGRFQIGTSTRLMNDGEFLDGVLLPMGDSDTTYTTITSSNNDQYLYVNVTIDNEDDIFLQVVVGVKTKLSIDTYTKNLSEDINVYSRDVIDEKIDSMIIDPSKTNFLKLNVDDLSQSKVLLYDYRITGSGTSCYIGFSEGSCVAMMEITPNTTYSLIFKGTDLINPNNGKSIIKVFTSSVKYTPIETNWSGNCNSYYQPTDTLCLTFESGDGDRYLYAYYTDTNRYHDFVLTKGVCDKLYYIPTSNIAVYNKDEGISRDDINIIVKDETLNLWDGIKYDNIRIGGSVPKISFQRDINSEIYVLKVEPNTTYSILVKDTDLIHNNRKYIKVLTSNQLYESDYVGLVSYTTYQQPMGHTNTQITTGDSDIYMYMYLFTKNLESPVFQVVEGEQTKMTISEPGDEYIFKNVSVYPKHKVYTKDEVDNLLTNNGDNKLVKSSEQCVITLSDKSEYTFEHVVKSKIGLDTWMLTSGKANGYTLWSGSDIEGPIKEVGADDFIGGVHGDEVYESITIICDGRPIALENDYNIDFNNLTIFVKSTLNRCNTTTPVFTRYKKLEFIDSKLIVSNRLICLVDDFKVNRYTGSGLYSVYKDLLNGYSVNTKPELFTDGGLSADKNMDIGVFFGDGYTITLETLSGKTDAYKGSVADFYNEARPRYKLYFDSINSSSGYNMNRDDELIASFSITIK